MRWPPSQSKIFRKITHVTIRQTPVFRCHIKKQFLSYIPVNAVTHKMSVPFSQYAHCITITNVNYLMLLKEIITVTCENQTLGWQNAGFLNCYGRCYIESTTCFKTQVHKSQKPGSLGNYIWNNDTWHFQHNIGDFSLYKICVSVYVHKVKKHQIMVRFTGHSRIVGPQYGTWFMLLFGCPDFPQNLCIHVLKAKTSSLFQAPQQIKERELYAHAEHVFFKYSLCCFALLIWLGVHLSDINLLLQM
jgi:hypothetical protein